MRKKPGSLAIIMLMLVLALPIFVSAQQTMPHMHDDPVDFFKINGQAAIPYPITQSSLDNFLLPDFASRKNFLVNEKIDIEINSKVFQTPFIESHNISFPDARFIWKFGDGQTASGANNTHAYAKPGSYILSVYVESKVLDAPQLIKSVLIHILPYKTYRLPKAVVKVNDQVIPDQFRGTVNLSFKEPVQLEGTHSVSGSSKITHYFWDLSDKTSSEGFKLRHTFNLASYNAVPILRVTDSSGFISDTSVEIVNRETNSDKDRIQPRENDKSIAIQIHAQLPATMSFSGGSIAGIPLCCQQRPVPRTRREQGVPFLVRAPQIETTSLGSVGRSVAVPSGP